MLYRSIILTINIFSCIHIILCRTWHNLRLEARSTTPWAMQPFHLDIRPHLVRCIPLQYRDKARDNHEHRRRCTTTLPTTTTTMHLHFLCLSGDHPATLVQGCSLESTWQGSIAATIYNNSNGSEPIYRYIKKKYGQYYH
jgi:hypothetical protein